MLAYRGLLNLALEYLSWLSPQVTCDGRSLQLAAWVTLAYK